MCVVAEIFQACKMSCGADLLEVPSFIKVYGPKPHPSQKILINVLNYLSGSRMIQEFYLTTEMQSANFVARQLGLIQKMNRLTRALTNEPRIKQDEINASHI
ncbi:hypothetical protein M758_UG002900 [Ceratodon purpureus]|nr:hypothetical protein M758_UG002900 [Ceratodon purpureus]